MSDQYEKPPIFILPFGQRIFSIVRDKSLVLLVLAVFIAQCYRMTLGVDLGDESYYISFIDGWLKTGVKASDVLVIHQTAELLVFPFAQIFERLSHGIDGLALFLRYIYLFASCCAAVCFYFFSRTRYEHIISVFAGLLIVSFIPFSLPAPSYNTLGMLGIISALSSLGVYLHKYSISWAIVSAVSWAIAVIAYPTFLVVFAVAMASTPVMDTAGCRAKVSRYLALCAALQAIGALLILSVYGWTKLISMLTFTNASLQISSGSSDKLVRSFAMLTTDIRFFLLCLAGIVVGALFSQIANSVWRGWLVAGTIAVLLAISYSIGPILYTRSHDFTLLLSVIGASFFLAKKLSGSLDHDKTVALLFAIGLLAGTVTSATATNGIVNFAVGGFFAAAVFLLGAMAPGRTTVAPHVTLVGIVVAFFIFFSFNFIYGERESLYTASSSRIEQGVFTALLTTRENKKAIMETSRFLSALPGGSVTVLGRFPGIYLLTAMKPKAISTWDFGQQNGTLPKVDRITEQFYATAANQPAVLLSVTDPWTREPSSYGRKLLSEYPKMSRLKLGTWTVDAFTR